MVTRIFRLALAVLALGAMTVAPGGSTTCEDCYECNPVFSDDFIEAYCCTGSQCAVWVQDDRCWLVKNDVSDCAERINIWTGNMFCGGQQECGGGGSGGGIDGGSDGSCEYRPGGFCPVECSYCIGNPGTAV